MGFCKKPFCGNWSRFYIQFKFNWSYWQLNSSELFDKSQSAALLQTHSRLKPYKMKYVLADSLVLRIKWQEKKPLSNGQPVATVNCCDRKRILVACMLTCWIPWQENNQPRCLPPSFEHWALKSSMTLMDSKCTDQALMELKCTDQAQPQPCSLCPATRQATTRNVIGAELRS